MNSVFISKICCTSYLIVKCYIKFAASKDNKSKKYQINLKVAYTDYASSR